MALYAVDEGEIIFAIDAQPNKVYGCLDCFGPVKRRRGRQKIPHFYHLNTTPTCRLHSQAEDHWIAQLDLQRRFPPGELQIERPFRDIGRVADLCWERKKVIFEIQCSPMTEKEAEMRFRDYRSAGYDLFFLLDDKRYNKRILRPAESYLRENGAYFLSIRRQRVYDQFEVFAQGKRARRGRFLLIDLQQIFFSPQREWNEELFPKQILSLKARRHFFGDCLSRALRFPHTMLRERALEIAYAEGKPKKRGRWREWLQKYLFEPYQRRLLEILKGR